MTALRNFSVVRRNAPSVALVGCFTFAAIGVLITASSESELTPVSAGTLAILCALGVAVGVLRPRVWVTLDDVVVVNVVRAVRVAKCDIERLDRAEAISNGCYAIRVHRRNGGPVTIRSLDFSDMGRLVDVLDPSGSALTTLSSRVTLGDHEVVVSVVSGATPRALVAAVDGESVVMLADRAPSTAALRSGVRGEVDGAPLLVREASRWCSWRRRTDVVSDGAALFDIRRRLGGYCIWRADGSIVFRSRFRQTVVVDDLAANEAALLAVLVEACIPARMGARFIPVAGFRFGAASRRLLDNDPCERERRSLR